MCLNTRDLGEKLMEAEDIREEQGFCPNCHEHQPCGCDPKEIEQFRRSGSRDPNNAFVERYIDTC